MIVEPTGAGDIIDGAITKTKLLPGCVTTDAIAAGAITADLLACTNLLAKGAYVEALSSLGMVIKDAMFVCTRERLDSQGNLTSDYNFFNADGLNYDFHNIDGNPHRYPATKHNAEYTAIVKAWNDAGLPRCTKTMLVNMSNADGDLQTVRQFFDAYGGDAQNDAVNAICNYSKTRNDSRYELGYRNGYTFFGFLAKGVGFFVDSAKPFEYFAKQKPKYGSGVSQSGCDAFTGNDVPF